MDTIWNCLYIVHESANITYGATYDTFPLFDFSWSQISGLANLNLFAQVTLDGNPIVSDPTYQKMISNDKRFFKDNTTVYSLKVSFY